LRQVREGAVVGSAVGAGLRRGRRRRRRVGGVEEEEADVMVAEVAELPLPDQAPRRSTVMGSVVVPVSSGGKRFSRKRHWRAVSVGERGHVKRKRVWYKRSRRLRSKTTERT